MMHRLPTPGQDSGIWGETLNDYLMVSHNPVGGLLPQAVTMAGAYTKPVSGIPEADLSSAVVTKLNTVVSGIADGSVTTAKIASGGIAQSAVTNLTSTLSTKLDKDVHILNVKDFGAVGDNVTDDSAAFLAAFMAALAARVTPVPNGNKLFQSAIYIPPGRYLITQANALMPNVADVRSGGLKYFGAGRGTSTINFVPAAANSSLLYNSDHYLGLTFEDLSFSSADATSIFMTSLSNGGAQNYVFNRVDWGGTWKYGIYMTGTNTNSEMTWFHCGIHGFWTAFLYSADIYSGGSDQFLNYDFFKCQVEYNAGNFIDMSSGGNINIYGGSWIHLGNGSAPQIFIALRGNAHALGVQRVLVQGIRVEHHHALSQLIYCEWAFGTVTFISCDTESWAANAWAPTMVQASFPLAGAVAGPMVKFDSCSLMGTHSYGYSITSFDFPLKIMYQNCYFINFPEAANFITIPSSGSNPGGIPPISFENCRGSVSNASIHGFDCVLNWRSAIAAAPRTRIISFTGPSGKIPPASVASAEVWLPINSLITDIRFYLPSGGSTSGVNSYSYTVTTSDSTPVTIGGYVSTGQPLSAGFNSVVSSLNFSCNTDTQRHLVLKVVGADQYVGAQILVSYLS
jgi:hypothetical protein